MESNQEYGRLKWLLERLKTAEDYCRPYFERAKRYYRLYRFASAVDADDWPYVNRVRSRDILAFVEDTTAMLVQTLFATMPFISVIPRETRLLFSMNEQIDPKLIGEQIERCVDYQISHEDTEFFEEVVDLFKGGAIMGNGYVGVYPKFGPGGRYLRPMLKVHDFWDVLPVGAARRLTRAKGAFIREFAVMEDLRIAEAQGFYRNVDKIKSAASSGLAPDRDWHRELLADVGITDWEPDNNDIEILHYFSGGQVITLADRKTIIRDSNIQYDESGEVVLGPDQNPVTPERPYPYDMPVVQYKYMPIPLEFFALGIPEVLEVLQEDKNLVRSARRDNIDLVIHKVLKIRNIEDINTDMIKYYPGALWPVPNMEDLQEMKMDDVTQSSFLEEDRLGRDMENALSLFGYARGMTPSHSEQPTTVMKLQQASLNRLDLAVKLAEFTTLQNIATRIIMLTRKYMAQEDYEAIIGAKDAGFYQLSEDDIRRFFYFKPVGSSVTHIKEIRQQQIQFALENLGKLPPEMMAGNIRPFTVDWYEAMKTVLETADVKNRDRILIALNQQQQGGGMPGMSGMPGMEGGLGPLMQMAQQLMGVPYSGA